MVSKLPIIYMETDRISAAAPEELGDMVEPLAPPAGKAASRVLKLPHELEKLVRFQIIRNART